MSSIASFEEVDLAPAGADATPAGADDPISQLEKHIGYTVVSFTDGHKMIQKLIEKVETDSKTFSELEAALKLQGDHRAANRIVRHSKDVLYNSVHQSLSMLEHVREVADLLTQAMDPEIQIDPVELKSIVESVNEEAWGAFTKAEAGKEKIQALAREMEDIQVECQEKIDKAIKEVQKKQAMAGTHQEIADSRGFTAAVQTTMSVVSGAAPVAQAGVGIASAFGGAALIAEIPLVGGLLTTTTTTGWIVTSTVVAFNPVGIAVAVGIGGVAAVAAISTAVSAKDAVHERKQALEFKEAAETEAEELRTAAEKATQCEAAASAIVVKAGVHEEMWRGMSLAAESAAHKFSSLKKIDPTGARRKKFNEKMEGFAKDLLHYCQAIEQYLFLLHKEGLFPPNLSLKQKLGEDRCLKMEQDWEAARSRTLQSLEDVEQGDD